MEMIVVTVKRSGESQVRDIELAPDIPAWQLATLIAQSFGWDRDSNGQSLEYEIEVTPSGIQTSRTLRGGETLAQAQVWDGSWLVLHPKQIGNDTRPDNQGNSLDNAVRGRRPLMTPDTKPPHPERGSAGYVLKRIDSD